MSARVLVSIGTTHPWNVAGIGVDARIASEYGLQHAMAIVALTAQDEGGLREKFAVPAAFVRAQLESLPFAGVAAFRVGALFDEGNVREIARFLGTRESVPLVVDPVFADTFGTRFATDETVDAFRVSMLPLASILTPNLSEAERLLGRPIATADAMVDAARALQARGPRAVLLKGGHLRGNPVDVLATSEGTEIFADARIPAEMRGTGCTLAAVVACELAQNQPIAQAVIAARAYVRRRIGALVK